MMLNTFFLISMAMFFILLSGLFAGAETGVYQLNRLRLRLGIEKKIFSFMLLGRTLKDSNALLISLLVGTNLSYYIVTSLVTFILLGQVKTEHSAELFAAFITAPVLFVFAELIPKSLFFYRSDTLMPAVAPILFFSHKIFHLSGIVTV